MFEKNQKESNISTSENEKFYCKKQNEINNILSLLELNPELLLTDHLNDNNLFKKIRKIATTKNGFLNKENRTKLWNYIFYIKKAKKGIIPIIKINQEMKMFLNFLNWKEEKENLNLEDLNRSNEYRTLLNDLPRTCLNIIGEDNSANKLNENNNSNNSNNERIIKKFENFNSKKNREIPEVIFFTNRILGYNYLQGLLNIFIYFDKLLKKDYASIIALNIYFEFFIKEFVDYELNKNNNDKISFISNIIVELYHFIYPEEKNTQIENYIPILSNKWIISSFIQEIRDFEKGYRILDFLIVNEPYIKYILTAVLIHTYSKIIEEKKNKNSYIFEEIFVELKKDDLNFIDFDETIKEVELINENKGNKIKNLLFEKFGKEFIFSFNLKNQGLITYYENLFILLQIQKPSKRIKDFLPNKKFLLYILIPIFYLFFYQIYDYINKRRIFW